jgi:indolepyruvate ferredoxin oxidoreductase beta subunit
MPSGLRRKPKKMTRSAKATRCVLIGIGGQGNLLASELLGQAALSVGLPAIVSGVHGMAQRGGVVECDVLMGDVASPIISGGEADVLVGFEPLEALRGLAKCNAETLVLTNVQPLPPFTVSIGSGVYPPVDDIVAILNRKVRRVVTLRGNDLAEQAGNPRSLNMVMLGALVGLDAVPVTQGAMRETISGFGREALREPNLRAFDLGLRAVRE